MIRKNNNCAFISCFIVFLEINIITVIPTMTFRLLLVPSQFMLFLLLAKWVFSVIRHPIPLKLLYYFPTAKVQILKYKESSFMQY